MGQSGFLFTILQTNKRRSFVWNAGGQKTSGNKCATWNDWRGHSHGERQMKNTAELRNVLIQDLTLLRNGEINRAEARTRAYLAKNIIDTLKVEIASQAMLMDNYSPVLLSPPAPLRAVSK